MGLCLLKISDFSSADQVRTREINLIYPEDSSTTNKTTSNAAERGFSLYLLTYEHEIAACKLGEGWLLVSRCSSSHLTCSQPFLLQNFLSAWKAGWCGGFQNQCSESPAHCTRQSWTAGGTDWQLQGLIGKALSEIWLSFFFHFFSPEPLIGLVWVFLHFHITASLNHVCLLSEQIVKGDFL